MKKTIIIFVIFLGLSSFLNKPTHAAQCGESGNETISCPSSCPVDSFQNSNGTYSYCCGAFSSIGQCLNTQLSCGQNLPAGISNVQCTCSVPGSGIRQLPNGDLCCGFVVNGQCNATQVISKSCGDVYSSADSANTECVCSSGTGLISSNQVCCGWVLNGQCNPTPVVTKVCGNSFSSAESASVECICSSGTKLVNSNTVCCGWVNNGQCKPTPFGDTPAACGTTYSSANSVNYQCNCSSGNNLLNSNTVCCGWVQNGQCLLSNPSDTSGITPTNIIDLDELIESIPNLRTSCFAGGQLVSFLTLGGIITCLLPYVYAFAGIGLLLFLMSAGFSYLTSAGDAKKAEAAKGKLTATVIGFIIIIVAFWVTQIVNTIFKLGTGV